MDCSQRLDHNVLRVDFPCRHLPHELAISARIEKNRIVGEDINGLVPNYLVAGKNTRW